MDTLSRHSLVEGAVLNINKPLGWTSFDVVKYISGRFKCKAGHAGTLDPMATGVLVICTGKKTKEIEHIKAFPKEYLATIHLGITRPSLDLETPVSEYQNYSNCNRQDIANAIQSFLGKHEQVPPQFSAKKVNGRPAYETARQGIERELKPSIVELHSAELISVNKRLLFTEDLKGVSIQRLKRHHKEPEKLPLSVGLTEVSVTEIVVKLVTGKGFYVRSFARDLAQKLNTIGTLNSLKRTAVGKYRLEDSLNIDGELGFF